MKKIIKENIKVFFGILIGLSLGGVSVFASSVITSKDVFYENTLSNVNNVQKAIEELYVLAQSNTPEGYIISENGIRYTGKNPNNYVSFNGELWRIIGIFDGKMKVIREESIKDQVWSNDEKNAWESSSLYNYLNTTYYNSLDSTSKNMVENATWRIGGWYTADITASQMVEKEENIKGAGANTLTATGFIGLMSASDYGYASSECYDSKPLKSYSNSTCTSTNWIFKNLDEWTLTSHSTQTEVFIINNDGRGDFYGVNYAISVRPSLYLKANVKIKSGSGTPINPYRLVME